MDWRTKLTQFKATLGNAVEKSDVQCKNNTRKVLDVTMPNNNLTACSMLKKWTNSNYIKFTKSI